MKVYNEEPYIKLLILFFSEFCATAMLLAFICLSCVNTELFPNDSLSCALGCGFAVATCIQCFGCVSGAHINPAVSIACFVFGNLSLVAMILYIVAQMLGGILGYAIFLGMVPAEALTDTVCLTLIHPTCSTLRAFFVEFILTATLIYFCCGIWDARNAAFGDSVAIRFACIVTLVVITGGAYTGASINPARSFAPALFHNNFDRFWVYILSQTLAAIVTPITWLFIFKIIPQPRVLERN